jgi:hypothetical protein
MEQPMQLNIRAGEVPELIRKTAEEITGAFYEMNRSERFRQQAGTQRRFIRQCWKDHVNVAVDVLSSLLAEPGRDEREKEQIYDAIVAFKMRASRGTPMITLGRLQ